MATNIELIGMDWLRKASDCLKLMAHPVRLRMAEILMQGEFPVHQVAALCGLPSHQASEHLRLMQGHGFLSSQRRGRAVYYKIASPNLPGLIKCIRGNCPDGQSVRVRTGARARGDERKHK
jgi:DNA-binding transcriptional ArsR family regulator